MRRQFAAGHGNERAMIAFDDFKVTDYKRVVKSDATESAQPIFGSFHQLDAYFCNFQGFSSVVSWLSVTCGSKKIARRADGYVNDSSRVLPSLPKGILRNNKSHCPSFGAQHIECFEIPSATAQSSR